MGIMERVMREAKRLLLLTLIALTIVAVLIGISYYMVGVGFQDSFDRSNPPGAIVAYEGPFS